MTGINFTKQIRFEIKSMNGLISRAAILTGFLMIPIVSVAGPPFDTDDPEPVDFMHWEYYLSSSDTFQPDFFTGTLPHVEVNYGILPNCQLHVLIPMNFNFIQNSEFQYGYAATELGFKYRFFRSSDGSVQIGMFPIFEVPTIKNYDFTDNKLQVYFPVWFQKSWDKLTTYGGCGYWINPGTNNKNWIFAGWEVQYDFSKYITLGGEIFCKTASIPDGKTSAGANIGGFVNFNNNLHLLFSVGHSITKDRSFTAYLGFQVTI